MMGSRANGKDPFFDSGNEEKHPGDVDGEISLLDDDHDDGGGEDEEESSTSPYMTHGVYNNAGSLSVMLEVTIEDGKVYDFYEALSTCYDGYVPTHLPGSVPFEFPHATKSYVEPKAKEKRLMAAKAFEEGPLRLIENFIRERGHGAIANENQCCLDGPIDPRLVLLSRRIRHSFQTGVLNPHIKELCDRVGFVYNILLWMADRMVGMMEEYCQGGADINAIPQKPIVQGYDLGQSVTNWKCIGGPEWMERPEFKSRLDAIGFDMSLNAMQAKFAARCRHLKDWKLRHGGSNPRKRGSPKEENRLYQFQYQTRTGLYNAEYMKVPKLKALFDEAQAIGNE
jgi:hypothetical protein